MSAGYRVGVVNGFGPIPPSAVPLRLTFLAVGFSSHDPIPLLTCRLERFPRVLLTSVLPTLMTPSLSR